MNDIFADADAEYRELNNELVRPLYRRFCAELQIPFHFRNQLPYAVDPEISLKEEPLHEEAMSLFNRLKPELVLFRDHVVSFQFTDWGDGFSYAKTRFTYTKLRSRTSSKPQPTTPSTLLDWKSVSATSAPSSRFS